MTITVSGSLGDALENATPGASATTCRDGYIGTIVLVPSGESTQRLGVRLVAGTTKDAEDCHGVGTPPDYGAGCIVARRSLAYIPHTPLRLPIVMRGSCAGVVCAVDQTCATGQCVPATIEPGQCFDSVCPEPLPPSDAGADAAEAGAPPDAASDGGAVYNPIANPANWSSFDATQVDPRAKGFFGAAFDGKYVYFAPFDSGGYAGGQWHGVTIRYDAAGAFTTPGSWSKFDIASLNPAAKGFGGAAFDGKYVYYVPYTSAQPSGVVARFDTTQSFSAVSAWSLYDIAALAASSTGYAGATIASGNIYLAPALSFNGLAARHALQTPLNQGWTTFSVATVGGPNAHGYAGAGFDGRYVYYAPFAAQGAIAGGLVARYDTQGTFGAGAAWQTFDVTAVDALAHQFVGSAFDGKYMYFAPYGDALQGPTSRVARYDVSAPFTAKSSWQTFDTTTVNVGARGFEGALFDGRYVYFVPFDNGTGPSSVDGLVTRYDTLSSFTAAAAWETFDMSAVNPAAKGFAGAAFDGQSVYFVPSVGSVVMRFVSRSPPALPVGYTGSFL